MHEFSIVMSLLEQCEKIASQHKAKGISRVSIKVGTLSGVEPELLRTAFNDFREEGLCRGAELQMEVAPLTLACNDCGQQSTPEEYSIICPHCQSRNTKVVDGEDMLLMQLELIND